VEFAAAAAQVRARPQRAVYLEAHGFRVQGTALPPEATLRRAALRQACKGTFESLQLLAAFDSSNHTDLPLRGQGRRATNVTPRRRLSWRTRARRRRCGARCPSTWWRQRDFKTSSLAGCGRGACPRMPVHTLGRCGRRRRRVRVGGEHWELCDTLRALGLPADVEDANLMLASAEHDAGSSFKRSQRAINGYKRFLKLEVND